MKRKMYSDKGIQKKHLKCNLPVIFFLGIAISLSACRSSGIIKLPKTIPDDCHKIARPNPNKIIIAGDIINKQFTYKLGKPFDLSRQFRSVFGSPKQAMNVDAFGEVSDSSWFTNRNAKKPMTIAEIARGPNTGPGPNLSSEWTIFRAKEEGVTVGFHIQDSQGEKYVIKFDPPGHPELPSGAEIVCTKLFHAAGYNVPQNYIVYFYPKILRLGDNVTFTDNLGRKRLMEQQDLEQMLLRVSIRPDGRVRAIASKYLVENPDNLLGPFKYQGTRSDDSNDIIPHQHRRELRGLRVMAAWLNHFDTKASNTLDVFTEEGYVKHFLIDFGSTLGSNGDELMPPEVGFENSFDVTQIFLNIFTLGLWVKAWERPYKIPYPSIGHFTSKNFHPKKYKFIIMNPAFDHMTDQDAYWGAKLVMCFTDEQIIAAVAEGQYSDPASASYLARTLIERRDIIGRYWFRSVVPLDRFRLLNSPEGAQMLAFVDLAVDTGIEKKEDLQYRYSLIDGEGNIIQKNTTIQGPLVIPLPSIKLSMQSESSRKKISRNNIWTIRIQKKHRQSSEWFDNINIYLMKDNYSQLFSLYGLKRDD